MLRTCSVRAPYVLRTCSVRALWKCQKSSKLLVFYGRQELKSKCRYWPRTPLFNVGVPSISTYTWKPSNSISTLKRGCGLRCTCLVLQCFRSNYAFHYAFQALAIKTVDSAYFQEITHLLRFQFPPTVGFLPHLSFKNWGGGQATLDRAALRR